MLRACDFVKLILKWAIYWNKQKSLRRFGRDICGSERNSKISKAAILYCLSAIVIPWIAILSLILRRKGFDNSLLTRTLALGFVYRNIIKPIRRLPKPIVCSTASR